MTNRLFNIIRTILLTLVIMLISQCKNSVEEYYETKSTINFGININDIVTRDANNDCKCLSFEEIKDLALNKKLFLVIDING